MRLDLNLATPSAVLSLTDIEIDVDGDAREFLEETLHGVLPVPAGDVCPVLL